jgi:hypothetical protein
MMRRFAIGALTATLGLVAPLQLAAQQPAAAPSARDQLRYQLQQFEINLAAAVRHAGDVVASQTAASGVTLFLNQPPEAHANVLDDYGLFFTVQVPGILQTAAMLLRSFPPPMPPAGTAGRTGPLPAGTVGAASTLVTPDPTAAPDLNATYLVALQEALIDAILDYSGSLPLKDSDWLTVAASDLGGPMPNALRGPASTMYLRIKGADLRAFREKPALRDAARAKVEVTHK